MNRVHDALARAGLMRIATPAALAYALAGLAYLLLKSVFGTNPEIDFKYIWVAGQLWAEGINPYSDDFARIGDTFFENTNTLDTWLYPPNWWLLSRALALFDVETAVVLWRSLNAALLLGGTVLSVKAMRSVLGRRWLVAGLFMVGYATTMQATAMTLSIGQTSILLFFGLCAVLYGLSGGRSVWVVIGLIVVALKPQTGIVVWAAIAALPTQRNAVFVAGLATLVLAAPGLLAGGFAPSLNGLIAAYLDYDGALAVNSPASTTGLRHLVDLTTGITLSALWLCLVAAVIAALGSFLLYRTPLNSPIRTPGETKTPFYAAGDSAMKSDGRSLAIGFWILLVLSSLVSLHSYDFVVVAPLCLICFSPAFPTRLRVAIGIGLLLIYRSSNMAALTGFYNRETLHALGPLIDSTAIMMMLVALAACLFYPRLFRNRERIAP